MVFLFPFFLLSKRIAISFVANSPIFNIFFALCEWVTGFTATGRQTTALSREKELEANEFSVTNDLRNALIQKELIMRNHAIERSARCTLQEKEGKHCDLGKQTAKMQMRAIGKPAWPAGAICGRVASMKEVRKSCLVERQDNVYETRQ